MGRIMRVQQFVPEEWCLACRRCCRFADPQDAQTPAFSTEESARAIAIGASPAWFAEAGGGSRGVRLAAHPCGGAQCPALESATHQCRIYAERPLDCQIYPLVVTRDASQRRLLLGADTKCPYVQQLGAARALRDYGRYVAQLFESPEGQRALSGNPALAGRPREEFWTMAPLNDPAPPPLPSPPEEFQPLVKCAAAFDAALNGSGRPLSAYHRAAWLAWRDLMHLWWGPIGGVPCLVAEQAGGYFLALPPLGAITKDLLETAFQQLGTLNDGAPVSRLDNVPEPLATQCRAWGYAVRPVEREYVYDRAALRERLIGRLQGVPGLESTIRPYRLSDADSCLQVYALWALKRQAAIRGEDAGAAAMIRDGFYAQRRWLREAEALDLRGWVAEIDGEIRGYTLGTSLTPDTAVVLAEMTTMEREGLPAALGAAVTEGFSQRWINTMGDAGLEALAALKQADRPAAIHTSYSVSQPT